MHVGSYLGIVPTTVRSTLGILHNMCATRVKYREGSTSKLQRGPTRDPPGKLECHGATEDSARGWGINTLLKVSRGLRSSENGARGGIRSP